MGNKFSGFDPPGCYDACDIVDRGASMTKIGVTFAAAFIVLASVFGGLQDAFADFKTIKVNIPSCLCQNISTTLRFTLSHIEGVKAVLANPITQSAIITFDDEKTNYDQIKDTLIRDRVYIVGEPEYLK
jgi:copper chaperone CopZ